MADKKTPGTAKPRKPRPAAIPASQLESMLGDALGKLKLMKRSRGAGAAAREHKKELRALKKAHKAELRDAKRAYARLAANVKKLLRRLNLDAAGANPGNETAAPSSN